LPPCRDAPHCFFPSLRSFVLSHKITSPEGEAPGDESGNCVSMNEDGSIVAIGAIMNAHGGEVAGHVRTYQWSDQSDSWALMAEDIDGRVSEALGWSVSLSADGARVAASSVGDILSNVSQALGRVRVYQLSGIE